jgi:hypothetical protein
MMLDVSDLLYVLSGAAFLTLISRNRWFDFCAAAKRQIVGNIQVIDISLCISIWKRRLGRKTPRFELSVYLVLKTQ